VRFGLRLRGLKDVHELEPVRCAAYTLPSFYAAGDRKLHPGVAGSEAIYIGWTMSEPIRTWEDYKGKLALPLNILVYNRPETRNGPYHAHCIQYSAVYARGQTQEDAVTEALDLLLHHLIECQRSGTEPMHVADNIYQIGFYNGTPMRDLAKKVQARLPVKVYVREPVKGEAVIVRSTEMKEIVTPSQETEAPIAD